MNDISFNELPKQLSRFLHRYHVVTFSLIVLGGMAAAIFLLNNILLTADQPSGTAATGTAFDKTTIDRIDKLKTRSDTPEPMSFPSGRVNPFVE